MWFALAKSHLLLRYTIVRGRLGEAKQETTLTNKLQTQLATIAVVEMCIWDPVG